jgi:hypothetical protein
MSGRLAVLLVPLVGCVIAGAQPVAPALPFEVASVKRNMRWCVGGAIEIPPAESRQAPVEALVIDHVELPKAD